MLETFRCLTNRVLVRPGAAEEVTKGGIVVPESVRSRPLEGLVLAVGPGNHNLDGSLRPIGISVGDRVVFQKYVGFEIQLNGEDLLVIEDAEILGVVEKIPTKKEVYARTLEGKQIVSVS